MAKTEKAGGQSYIFYLNMQMIADEFQDRQIPYRYCPGSAEASLVRVRLYDRSRRPDCHQVSIIDGEQFDSGLSELSDAFFIVAGSLPPDCSCHCSAIFVDSPHVGLLEILDIVQDLFERNARWAGRLQTALINVCSLDEICRISQPYFMNPVFIHNPQYYILGNSGWVQGMSEWDEDKITGRYMTSARLINHFKTDPEYIKTFDTHGAHVYSGNFRSFRCAYVNLWNHAGAFEGRLCINELQSSLKPGQFHAMEYLARIITASLENTSMSQRSSSRPFEQFLCRFLGGKSDGMVPLEAVLSRQGWKRHDRYVCMRLDITRNDIGPRAIVSTCNLIQAEFVDSASFFYKDDILVIINLSRAEATIQECLTQLAPIVREGLLQVGASNEFEDFALLPRFYIQADLALTYGGQKDATKWCHRFQDIALSYCADQACKKLGPHFVCAPDLLKLQAYDQENESELYHTLQVYLENDRNAARTAQLLFIHRSTLFYRLDKIKKLMELNLEHNEDMLYLRLSFYMMEQYYGKNDAEWEHEGQGQGRRR